MPSSRTVYARGGRVSTTVETLGAGPPIVYFHGPFGLVERPLVELLAEHHTVHVPAHPGFEGTTGIEELDNTAYALTFNTEEVLDGLGLHAPVDVVGHSFGASIASELAAIFPHRVRRLVAISPIGVWRDDRPQPDLFGLTPGALGRTIFHDSSTPAAKQMLTPPPDREEARQWNRIRRRNMIGAAKFLWPLPDQGFSRRAYRLRTPTLLIWGEHDGVVPPDSYAEAWLALLPRAEVELIPQAGHMTVVEQPDATARVILAYLKRMPAAVAGDSSTQ